MTTTNYEKLSCPVARCLSILGDQWTFLIVRDALSGLSRFSEFRDSLGISRNLLSTRLQHLCNVGIFEKRALPSSKRYEYLPTEKCRDLQPVILTMAGWGNRWFADEELTRVECRDRRTGNLVDFGFVDRQTNQVVADDNLIIERLKTRLPDDKQLS